MKVILPYRGEFGHKIMWHVPTVNAIEDEKIVCCEYNEQCLYPGAKEYIVVENAEDRHKHEHIRYDIEFINKMEEKLKSQYPDADFYKPHRGRMKHFLPQPCKLNGIKCDIVICPRLRKTGTLKNWNHFEKLVDILKNELKFNLFAVGAPDSSVHLDLPASWDYENYVDASVEAFLNCKTTISTDTGTAFLSLLCGKSINLISCDDGKTAPGYPGIRMDRFDTANWMNVRINIIHNSWNDAESVVNGFLL